MKRIKSSIPQDAIVQDPFGFGCQVRIRRAGHPSADRTGYETRKATATMQLYVEMSAALRRIRERNESADAVPDLGDQDEIAAQDHQFSRFLTDWRQRTAGDLVANAESYAASLVGGWAGDLPKEDLPENGAFKEALVRRVFFEQHGEAGAGDAFYIPALQEWESEAAVPGSYVFPTDSRYAKARKAIDAANAKAEKVKEELTAGALKAAEEKRGLLARLDDEEREELANRILKTETAIAKDLDEKLAKSGLRRSPYAGTFIREAIASWLIDEAGRIEKTFKEYMGL